MPRRYDPRTGVKKFVYHASECAALVGAAEILLEAADCKVPGAEDAARSLTAIMGTLAGYLPKKLVKPVPAEPVRKGGAK